MQQRNEFDPQIPMLGTAGSHSRSPGASFVRDEKIWVLAAFGRPKHLALHNTVDRFANDAGA
jgi:hypothetical protein